MKLKNTLIQAAVAAAFGSAALSAGAAQDFSAPVSAFALATEIFGAGSAETLLTVQDATYQPSLASVAASTAAGMAGKKVDIKFTLSGGAVFGEALNDNAICQIAKFVKLSGGAAVDTTACGGAAGDYALQVTSGGAIGDNTIAIQITLGTAGAPKDLVDITFGGYKIKNLTNALKTEKGKVQLGVNYTQAYAVNPAVYETSLSGPVTLFVSENGVDLTLTSTATPVSWYINSADDRKLFTNKAGAAGESDFSKPGLGTVGTAVTSVGSLVLNSGSVKTATNTLSDKKNIRREDLTPFVFMSGDDIKVVLNGNFDAFKKGAIWLADTTAGKTCADKVAAAWAKAEINTIGTKATFDLSKFSDSAINNARELCFQADGTTEIQETKITATATIDYFNVRYVDEDKTASGSLVFKVNGVQQAIPYALSGTSAYKTYLRVANNSTVDGRVTVTCRKNTGGDPVDGVLDPKMSANTAKLYSADDLTKACTTNGVTGNDFGYVIVRGEFAAMDAGQYMFNPDGTVTQLVTNNTAGGNATNANSLNAQ